MMKLDRSDLKILDILSRDGRITKSKLAEAINLSVSPCWERVKRLEKAGVIGTRLYESHPPRYEYFLTDKGKALGPVLKALYNWGVSYG